MNLHDALPESHYLAGLENLRRKLLRWMLWSSLAVVVCVVQGVWRVTRVSGAGPAPGGVSDVLLSILGALAALAGPFLMCFVAGAALTCGRVTTRIMATRSIRDTMAALTAQGLPPMTAHLLAEKAWNKRMLRRTGIVMVLCSAVVLGAFSSRGLPFWIPGWAGLSAALLFFWAFIRFAIAGVRLLRSCRPGVAAAPPLASTHEAI